MELHKRQYEIEITAQKLYHIVRTPILCNFKMMLRTNITQDFPVMIQDIIITEKIFGPSMSTIKGHTARRQPRPVQTDTIQIPQESIIQHSDIELSIDMVYMNKEIGLTTSNKTVRF